MPEDYIDWKDTCAALETLTSLRGLEIEIVVWNQGRHHDDLSADRESLMTIFSALMHIKAAKFTIELNIELPQSVKDALGLTPFKLTYIARSFDHSTFIVGGSHRGIGCI